MIEIKNLSKKYGNRQALENISLQIHQGEIIGLFGENGAGKTTFMKSILGFHRFQGSVTLDGMPVSKKNIDRISFATVEHSFFPNLTPQAHMEFYQMLFPCFRKKRFIALMNFFELRDNVPLKHFSTGQQNQFEVILALSQGADYILMDEPFSGNDVFNRKDFYKVLLGILEPSETVILSTHLLEEVDSFISRALLLHQGRLIGDRETAELEEDGMTLMDFVRDAYHYRQDRISTMIAELEN